MPEQSDAVSKGPITGGILGVVCRCSSRAISEIINSILASVISSLLQKGNGVTLLAVVVSGLVAWVFVSLKNSVCC
jgi:hypothetical protein